MINQPFARAAITQGTERTIGMNRIRDAQTSLLLLLVVFAARGPLADTPSVKVDNVRKVFDDGEHNAFTDLVIFRDALYLAFRTCPDGHGVSPNASVVILKSSDGITWERVHTFRVAKRDTRDPHFLVFKDRLFVYSGTWYSGDAPAKSGADLELNLHLGYAVWSDDGDAWSEPQLLEGTFGHYVWRAATYDGRHSSAGGERSALKWGRRTSLARSSLSCWRATTG